VLTCPKYKYSPRHKVGHFGDDCPSQSLGLVLKKLNLTQQSIQHKKKWSKLNQKKNKKCYVLKDEYWFRLVFVRFKNCSYVCMRIIVQCTQLSYSIQHRTVLFPSYLPDNHHSSDVYWRGGATHLLCATLRLFIHVSRTVIHVGLRWASERCQ